MFFAKIAKKEIRRENLYVVVVSRRLPIGSPGKITLPVG
jgi:hypothetical protein